MVLRHLLCTFKNIVKQKFNHLKKLETRFTLPNKLAQERKNRSTLLGQGGPKIMHAYTAALTLQFKKNKSG
jgi:ribosomal protein S17E